MSLQAKQSLIKGFTVLIFGFYICFVMNCGEETILEPEKLNIPKMIGLYPKNRAIKVKFEGTNYEKTFDGYNIYLSKSSGIRAQTGLSPLKNESTGSLPTIVRTAKHNQLNNIVEYTITLDADNNRIENGVTYYVCVRAHSYRGVLSEYSAEASTTPRVESESAIVIYSNEGIDFNNLTVTPVSPHFRLTFTNLQAVITPSAGTLIQNRGYFANWEEVNKAPLEGYINAPLNLAKNNVYILKLASNNYAKLYIIEINPVNKSVKLYWAYQRVIGNTDL